VTDVSSSGILEEYHTKVSEARSTLDSLRERLYETMSQQVVVRKDIENFQTRITLQTGNTCSGIFRTKGKLTIFVFVQDNLTIFDDLESIQRMHKLRVQSIKVGPYT
jgi:hypothetical protein